MSDLLLPTSPPDRAVRFRLQTLLIVTAVVAVLAAMAGPFYRRQTPEARQVLLIYWGCISLTAGLFFYIQWRESWKLPPQAGEILCVLLTTGRAGRRLSPWTTALISIAWLGMIGWQSYHLASHADASGVGYAIVQGIGHATMIGGFLLMFVPRPFYFCENGVPIGPQLVPWRYIRSAEWTPENRALLRLHRIDGDLFANVPDRLRGRAGPRGGADAF